jgi:hypothetical protein
VLDCFLDRVLHRVFDRNLEKPTGNKQGEIWSKGAGTPLTVSSRCCFAAAGSPGPPLAAELAAAAAAAAARDCLTTVL